MNKQRYDRLTRYLHWVSAAVILWASLSGFYLATLDQHAAIRGWLSWFNVSLTTVYIPVFVVRVIHACRSQRPTKLAVPGWQQRVAGIVHAVLYALTSVVLVSGVLMMDHAIDVFGIVTLPNPITDSHWNAVFYKVHRQSCAALFLLIVLHVAAVIRHQRAGRRVLARMT